MELEIPKSNSGNKIAFSGLIVVSEKLFGPIDYSMDCSRCSLDMKSCEKYGIFNIKDVCRKLNDTSTFYSKIIKSFEPPIRCPIESGNYTILPSVMNLDLLEHLPIDNYVYIANAKMVSMVKMNGTKTKNLAHCSNMEMKVVKTRVQS